MNRVIIDFETYSDVDISTRGLYNYAKDPSTEILCMGFKINDQRSCLWIARSNKIYQIADTTIKVLEDSLPNFNIYYGNMPKILIDRFYDPEYTIYAHNAEFELEIIKQAGMNLTPEYFEPINTPSRFIDTMALCARNKLPLSLEKACEALECEFKKNPDGKKLIKKCCTPGNDPTLKDYVKLFAYCVDDIDATASLLSNLPADHLTDYEQKIWELTVQMNRTGVHVDMETVDSVVDYLAKFIDETKKDLPEITNGLVNTPGQTQKIVTFCKDKGVSMPNLQAQTVEQTLQRNNLPDAVRRVLTIRQLLGQSSVKKYIALKNLNDDGVVKGNLVYHGAGTGRWAGRGFQYHNLPRAKFKTDMEVEAAVLRFRNDEPMKDPVSDAKKLIRPMIVPPTGYSLIVSDFSSIENRILAWLCDDFDSIELFKAGKSQYIDMAAYVYNKSYGDIEKGTPEYTMGKALVLGCGYQMGAKRFVSAAADFGIEIDMAQADSLVKAYRAKYYKVVQLWKAFENAVKQSVLHPGYVIEANRCEFLCVTDHTGRRWLRIILPSTRGLMYMDPRIESGKYGKQVTYLGYKSTYGKMLRVALTPGLITENIDQAIARDLLCAGKMNIIEHMPFVDLCLTVQDELGAYIRDEDLTDNTLTAFNYFLCDAPEWAEGLPIAAEGYIAKRYKKD